MKFINREYGIKGRPPEIPDYYEEISRGPLITKDCYPEKPYVGAGLDSHTPCGAMLIGAGGSRWGIKISCNVRGKWLDSEDYLQEIGKLYAVSREGNFTYFAYSDMTATIVKYSKNALVISLATVDSIKLRITFCLMKPCEGEIKAMDNIIKGSSNRLAVIPGSIKLNGQRSIYRDRYEVVSEDNKEYFTAKTYRKPQEIIRDGENVSLEYELNGSESRLFIYAAVGDEKIYTSFPEEDELINGTSMEEIAYSTTKTIGRGQLGRGANGFINTSMYHRVYNPFMRGHMFIESRTAIDKYYAFNAADLNVASIIASYIGDFDTAKAQLEMAYGDDILAPLALWITFLRSRDNELLKRLYREYSKKFVPSGDLVISKDKAVVGYCMEGSPLKEFHNPHPMYSLDMSCFRLLAMDIMERIALVTGAPEHSLYAAAKSRLKLKINDILWDSRSGIYVNRYVDGDYSKTIGITSFYPLIAGAVDSMEKLDKLITHLKDKRRFYGERMIPTLSKNHPECGVKIINQCGNTVMPYEEFRGEIIPYMNYLVYQGLIRYGVYDLAGEIAYKSSALWNRWYRKGNYEVLDRYLPVSLFDLNLKERTAKGAERHSLSGNLMALMGFNELMDIEYFRDDMKIALRFGTMVRGEHGISRMKLLGRSVSVTVDDNDTNVSIDGIDVFRGEGGKFIVRNYLEDSLGAEFTIVSEDDLLLHIRLPIIGICLSPYNLTFSVSKGCNKVTIEGGKLSINKIY